MTVQQVLRKLGSWSIQLVPDAPPGVLSSLEFLGHVAVIPGRVNPAERGDECLTLARYVGVLREVEAGDQVTLSGSGMAFWLGDEDGKGPVIEAPGVVLSGATFANSIRALLPASGAVTEGTLTAIAGTYSGKHIYQTARTAVDYVCDLFGGDWRVTNDGKLDAGPASALFVTTPRCVIARRDVAGVDMGTRALAGDMSSSRSATDYTSRVVVVAEGLATGSATAASVPYTDLHGNTVSITRVVDEQDDTQGANASARAQMVLNLWNGTRRGVRLAVDDFDVAGDFTPGDVVWVWDPDAGLVDTANEVQFRGRTLNPVPVRVLAVTWPVTAGYTVAYRSGTGAWTDLTPWVAWESQGGGEVEVADSLSASLTAGIGSIGTVVSGGGGGAGDPSVPGVPVFGTFTTTSYQPTDGLARAAVKLIWTQPLNVDGSTIVDGDHYEIRYRPTGTTDWQSQFVAWDQTSTTVTNLPPSTGFDWQVRAVDYASPVNYGAWSSTTTFSTADDTTPPPTPAAPTVAASLIAVQVTHTLGQASGGTFNLPLDLDHFEVHVATSSGFTPSTSSLLGKLPANAAMVTGSVPAVGTFQVDTIVGAGSTAYVKVIAVDRTGNRSPASSAASSTAQLIDSAHISDLTASKITAGTITAAVVIGGSATFSGALSAATGTFAGSLSAATGTFAGNLSAAGGTFTGSLSGNSITGATITGGTITGGTVRTSSGGTAVTLDGPSNALSFRYAGSTIGHIVPLTSYGLLLHYGSSPDPSGGSFPQIYLSSGSVSLSAPSGSVSLYGSTVAIAAPSGFSISHSASVGGSLSAAGLSTSGNLSADGTVTFPDVYSVTTATAANVTVLTSPQGRLRRFSSSRRYKTEITDAPAGMGADVLALRPVTFYDRTQVEENGGTDGLDRYYGLIAEEVQATLGDTFVQRSSEGVEGVSYHMLTIALIPVVRDLRERLAAAGL